MVHETFGYCAQGVVESTARLPDGWQDVAAVDPRLLRDRRAHVPALDSRGRDAVATGIPA
jgi:hypothetical protein